MSEKLQKRQKWLISEFKTRFGFPPNLFEHASGRVDLMGSHTDYNQGHVLTLAINRDTWVAAHLRNDKQVTTHSLNLEGVSTFNLDDIQPDLKISWANYVRGVAKILVSEGYQLQGLDILIHSIIPLRSGLSSSAALEVAVARMFNGACDLGLDAVEIALLCKRAENEFVGMNCGILDQYTSSVGQVGSALLLDCRSITSTPVTISDDLSVVICDTQSHRELTGSEYPERRLACEQGAQAINLIFPQVKTLRDVTLDMLSDNRIEMTEIIGHRSKFIVEEEQRVLKLSEALPVGDRNVIRDLTFASFEGARDLFEICTPEMEAMHAAMVSSPGIIGARQAGAGFGGCMVAFVDRSLEVQFAESVQQIYEASTGILPIVYKVA